MSETEKNSLMWGIYHDADFNRVREKLREYEGKLILILIERIGSGRLDESSEL